MTATLAPRPKEGRGRERAQSGASGGAEGDGAQRRKSAPNSTHFLFSGALVGQQGPGGAQMERRASGVSRALVNTLGKLGRWTRAFAPPPSAGGLGDEGRAGRVGARRVPRTRYGRPR